MNTTPSPAPLTDTEIEALLVRLRQAIRSAFAVGLTTIASTCEDAATVVILSEQLRRERDEAEAEIAKLRAVMGHVFKFVKKDAFVTANKDSLLRRMRAALGKEQISGRK